MLITCKCLNINIDIKGTEFRKYDKAALMLTPIEEAELFFKEILHVADLVSIKTHVSPLWDVRNVGRFTIHRCINCSTDCYATNGTGCTFVSASLIMDSSAILQLQSHVDYSPAFRIIIKGDADSDKSPVSATDVSGPQSALSLLQKQLGHVIQEQMAKTEERVRVFAEQQKAQLDMFRDKAHLDHKALVRILLKAQKTKVEGNNEGPLGSSSMKSAAVGLMGISTPPTTPPSPVANGNSIVQTPRRSGPVRSRTEVVPIPPNARRIPVNRSLSLYSAHNAAGSLDTEGLFDLDGMEDQATEHFHSEGDSDTDHDESGSHDSHDEGIDLHRKRASSISLAKSLPVNVPVYPRGNPRVSELDPDDHENETTDIAASIKALARSVHGDAVFGDLPRPRFSTQI